MLVKTLRRHGYAKQIRIPGDEYEIKKEKHVRVLEAIGKVKRVPVVIPAPPKGYSTPIKKKATKKKTTKKKATKKKTTKKKTGNTYNRKDLVAE